MKFRLTESQFEFLFEDIYDKVPETVIFKLFKYIQAYKKKGRNREDLLQFIKKTLTLMGISEEYSLFVLESYLLNFRKDGDYSGLTKENFIDPRKTNRQKWTPNTKSNLFTVAQLPFRGSNLEGIWKTDPKGVGYYEVTSYGWYPIYIFKNGIWYENLNRYSSSTGRQMSNANPVERSWNEDLGETVYVLDEPEMKRLKSGATHDEIMNSKIERLKSKEKEFQSKRISSAQHKDWYWHQNENQAPNFRAKFKINSIKTEGDKATIVIDIYDVVKTLHGRSIPTSENYLKGEIPNVTREKVEESIRRKLLSDLRGFIGPRFHWYRADIPKDSLITLEFNHLKK